MAIILGSKLVKDLKENDRVAIGVTLPFVKGNSGYFAQSYQTIDQTKSNIQNLLLTRKGERIMHPDFGTDLYELLFSQNTEQLEEQIQTAIESAIELWLPYVTIQEIIVAQSNENKDMNAFKLSITFGVDTQPATETVTFNITE